MMMDFFFLDNTITMSSAFYPEYTTLTPSSQDAVVVTQAPAAVSSPPIPAPKNGMSPVEIGVVSSALAIALITAGLLASLIGRGR